MPVETPPEAPSAAAASAAGAARSGTTLFDEAFLKKLEYLHVVSKKVFAGRLRADRRSKKTGSGVEFADHRDYSFGDDFRYIDWSLYGRMDRLLVRMFEEEEDLHIYLAVDRSRSMGVGDKLEHALKITAALAYVGLANLDRVSILPFADSLDRERMPPARGKGRIFKVFEFLRHQKPAGVTDLRRAMGQLVKEQKRRGLVVVVSDLYDANGYADALNELRYQRFEPMVVQVFDQREVRPNLKGDLEIVDCETGEVRPVTVSQRLLDAYAREHARYRAEVEEYCRKSGVPFFSTTTDVPFDDLVLRVFRAGGFLR
jgi:uncharacterized protein (DUF58 family)